MTYIRAGISLVSCLARIILRHPPPPPPPPPQSKRRECWVCRSEGFRLAEKREATPKLLWWRQCWLSERPTYHPTLMISPYDSRGCRRKIRKSPKDLIGRGQLFKILRWEVIPVRGDNLSIRNSTSSDLFVLVKLSLELSEWLLVSYLWSIFSFSC